MMEETGGDGRDIVNRTKGYGGATIQGSKRRKITRCLSLSPWLQAKSNVH